MRVRRAGAAIASAMVALLWAGPAVTAGPADEVVAVGQVEFELTNGRYSLPAIASLRFTGSFSSGTDVVTGRVRGSGAVLDTATVTYRPIELSRPDGRLAGTCEAAEPAVPADLGLGVGRRLTLSCTVRIDAAPAQAVVLEVAGVPRSVSGDPTYGIQRTVYVGTFAST